MKPSEAMTGSDINYWVIGQYHSLGMFLGSMSIFSENFVYWDYIGGLDL